MYLKKLRWVGVRKKFREESPLYRFVQTNLNNGEHITINLGQGTKYGKYTPYNFCQVVNNTNQELILSLSGKLITLPGGTIRSIDEETVPAFRYIDLYNASGSNATGNIEILWQKVVSQRMILRKSLMGEDYE